MKSTINRIMLPVALAASTWLCAVPGAWADSYSFGATQGVTAPTPGQGQIEGNSRRGGQLGASASGMTGDGKPWIQEIELPEAAKNGSGQATNRSSRPDAANSKWELSEFDASTSFSAGQDTRMDSKLKDDATRPNPRGNNLKRRQNP